MRRTTLLPFLLVLLVVAATPPERSATPPPPPCDPTTTFHYGRRWKLRNTTAPPRWSALSHAEQLQFTKCHTIPLELSFFVDDSGTDNVDGTHYKYDAKYMRQLQQSATSLVDFVQTWGATDGSFKHAIQNRMRRPKQSDVWLLEALQNITMQDQHVLIIGSMSPWYECLCLAFGAASIDVLEYNRVEYEHEQITTYKADEFWNTTRTAKTYDVILSISSQDHDGLGRYGDNISPDGDLITMKKLANADFFTEDTLLIITVPIGEDLLAYNLMRIYGEIRLPLLFQEYTISNTYGYEPERKKQKYGGQSNFRKTYEPVFVLQRNTQSNGNETNSTTIAVPTVEGADEL